jgi:hypothetical protein
MYVTICHSGRNSMIFSSIINKITRPFRQGHNQRSQAAIYINLKLSLPYSQATAIFNYRRIARAPTIPAAQPIALNLSAAPVKVTGEEVDPAAVAVFTAKVSVLIDELDDFGAEALEA